MLEASDLAAMPLGAAPAVRQPFSDDVCEFLAALSRLLRQMPEARRYPEIAALSFWCRRQQLAAFKEDLLDGKTRLGLGLVFHIAPANVPLNFAYSAFFGLLAGNSNIVRLPSKPFPQVDLVLAAIASLQAEPAYAFTKSLLQFVRYPAASSATATFSSRCDARLIWGGDETIAQIRSNPLPPRALDLAFADRLSVAMISLRAWNDLAAAEQRRLCQRFYNDTYLMDQNACSSPHLVVFIGDDADGRSRECFWQTLASLVATEYPMTASMAINKYTQLCEYAVDAGGSGHIRRYGNELYRVVLEALPPDLAAIRGHGGYFYEYLHLDPGCIAPVITKKFQTLTYFGFDKAELTQVVLDQGLPGIDRIVPIGRALDIEPLWDGINLITALSRVVVAH